MHVQMSNPSNDNRRTSDQQDARRMPAAARTSTSEQDKNQRSAQAMMSQDTKKVEEWAGDCMTGCYNA